MTQNQVAYFNARETQRHNKMYEEELNRHQLAEEAIKARANAIQATMNYVNAVHYMNMDAETHRSNLAREQETKRSNLASEYLTSAQLAETSRHNKVNERLTSSLNASLIKRNYAEASYTTENTKYVQELTNTQAKETEKRGYEADQARIGVGTAAYQRMKTLNEAHSEAARTKLLQEQAKMEWTKGFRNVTGGINDIVHALQGAVNVTSDVFGQLFGSGGVTTMQQQNMDWFNNTNVQTSGGYSLDDYMSGQIDVQTFLGN